jgi:hypothetical protein
VNRRFGGNSVHTNSTRRHIPEDGILHEEIYATEKRRTCRRRKIRISTSGGHREPESKQQEKLHDMKE